MAIEMSQNGIVGMEFSEAAKAKEIYERAEKLKQEAIKVAVIEKDGSNTISIPGWPYKFEARGDQVLVIVDTFKSGYECRTCLGAGNVTTEEVEKKFIPGEGPIETKTQKVTVCPSCNGKKALLHLADESKSLPCTGVIGSMGPEAKAADSTLKLYQRVLFGPFSGKFLPLKAAGIVLKTMSYREIVTYIYGGEELASFDFILTDKEFGG